jgi:hypothetical protein
MTTCSSSGASAITWPLPIAHIEAPQYQVRGFFAAHYAFKDPAGAGADVVTVDNAPSGS